MKKHLTSVLMNSQLFWLTKNTFVLAEKSVAYNIIISTYNRILITLVHNASYRMNFGWKGFFIRQQKLKTVLSV